MGLSPGAIAAIVIGVLVLGTVMFFYFDRCNTLYKWGPTGWSFHTSSVKSSGSSGSHSSDKIINSGSMDSKSSTSDSRSSASYKKCNAKPPPSSSGASLFERNPEVFGA